MLVILYLFGTLNERNPIGPAWVTCPPSRPIPVGRSTGSTAIGSSCQNCMGWRKGSSPVKVKVFGRKKQEISTVLGFTEGWWKWWWSWPYLFIIILFASSFSVTRDPLKHLLLLVTLHPSVRCFWEPQPCSRRTQSMATWKGVFPTQWLSALAVLEAPGESLRYTDIWFSPQSFSFGQSGCFLGTRTCQSFPGDSSRWPTMRPSGLRQWSNKRRNIRHWEHLPRAYNWRKSNLNYCKQ